MIKTVAVKNLLFHFHNDLLFFEIHSLGSKRNKKSLCSRTFYAPLQYYPMQNSFQIILLFKSSVDPKKKNIKVISPYCHYLLVWGKILNITLYI